MNELVLKNEITVDTYLDLRGRVGWKKLTREQAQKAIEGSLHITVAYHDGKPVGMGRIVGDGAVICYVQDLVVLPEVQGQGVGSSILQELTAWVDAKRISGTEMMFCLMCAKGREPFYTKHNFIPRPTDTLGPGMIQYLH